MGNAARKPGRPTKRDQVINGLGQYIRLARLDAALSLDLTKIARRIGVHRHTIDNHGADPAVAALLVELGQLDEQRNAERDNEQPSPAAEPAAGHARPVLDGPSSENAYAALRKLSDPELDRRITREIEASVWAMQTYVGHRRRSRDVNDAPRVAFDLDEALKRLHAISARLKPLVVEHNRRNRERRGGGLNPEMR